MKLWFGVSKFASTSSLVYAVEWEKASDLVLTSHETRTALSPVSMSNYTMSCRPNFPTGARSTGPPSKKAAGPAGQRSMSRPGLLTGKTCLLFAIQLVSGG